MICAAPALIPSIRVSHQGTATSVLIQAALQLQVPVLSGNANLQPNICWLSTIFILGNTAHHVHQPTLR